MSARIENRANQTQDGCGEMTYAIEMNGVVKTFGTTRALDEFDLHVRPGEIHGFLGPNGAGKSTAIRVLLGLLRADSGTARILGADPWDAAVAIHHRLAYVPGDVSLWPNLTGGEAIDLFARLRGSFDQARRDAMIERFDLDPTKKARTYSKGNRQKVALVAAFASDVELLLLDEPTAGLDPLMEVVFQDVLHEEKARGRTVLLSSHILGQVEKLADTITIIRQGHDVESGTLADLRHLTRSSIEAEVTSDPSGIRSVPGVHELVIEGNHVRFNIDGAHLAAAVGALHDLGLRSLVCQPPTLEELFMRHYGDDLSPVDAAQNGVVRR